jgi:hypothetical protein
MIYFIGIDRSVRNYKKCSAALRALAVMWFSY